MTELLAQRQAYLDRAADLDRQADAFRAKKQYKQSGKLEHARRAVMQELSAFDKAHPDVAEAAYQIAVARIWERTAPRS